MQPIEANQGCPLKSQLLDSLTVYLNNKRRLQPIIGLGCIIECVTTGSQGTERLYLCEVCVCRLSRADIRTHIMGSLHRYNYIKFLHPDLVPEWKEGCDLSKLAWPLMEVAKTLEEKEGPGDVKLIELEDSVFQTLAAFSESDAVSLIHIVRTGYIQSCFEEPSVQLEQTQPQRTVLLNPDQQRCSDTNTQMFSDASVPTDGSFLDNYAGTDPLIGLSRVSECRDEDGHTHCFLCHCCRIRSNKEDIIDHLTGSSHLVNYLVETCPEQMESLTADNSDNYELLQSVAKKVEKEEGRERLKVVKAPEYLCVQLTGRSYHWCVKMLCDGWPQTDTQNTNLSVEGFNVNTEMSHGKGGTVMTDCRERQKTKRNTTQKRDTVFSVSLPLTQGPLLLKRASFSEDTITIEAGAYVPQSDSDPMRIQSGPEEEDELDFDATLRPETNLTIKIFQENTSDVSGYDQCGDLSEGDEKSSKEDENNYEQHTPQDIPSEMCNGEWPNQVSQAQNEWMLPPGCYTQAWASHHLSHGPADWYKSTSQATVNTNVPMENTQTETISDAPLSYSDYYNYYNYYNYYHQQQAHYQYMAQDGSGPLTAVEGAVDYLVDQNPYLNAAVINVHPQ